MGRILAGVLVLSSAASFAQQRATPPPRVTEVNIDNDELIEGSLNGPDGVLVIEIPRPEFSNLIRVRTSFADKVMTSDAELP